MQLDTKKMLHVKKCDIIKEINKIIFKYHPCL